jgi:hypothetical protein
MGAKREAKKEFAKEQELAKLRAREAQKAATKLAAQKRAQRNAAEAAAARQARRAAMTPSERASDDKRQAILGFVVMVIIVLGIGGCIVAVATADDPDEERTTEEAVDADRDEPEEADPAVAFEICRDFVKDRLRSPGSATFRNYYEDDGEVRSEVDGAEVTITSTVDSENGFGAELRTPFVCTVRDEGGHEWSLVALNLLEG